MRTLFPLVIAALLLGCQTPDDASTSSPAPVSMTGPAVSAIAGDMASRLSEQIGPANSVTIKMNNDKSDFATALEAALKGWGYAVITDGKVGKDVKLVELTYSVDGVDGQVLARLSTSSIALTRVYTASTTGAVPASPLSIMQPTDGRI
ncbi:conjugal transfer protein TrbH [Rhizobium tropici]|uniref:Conjugal transfer protein TrbH n=1 Tax=Rhizobium tropici TaxID=398 RepID=A0A5B0WC33_RHITR|nr:conjugal transfer protein TrbH [Rhizobium tropici]KAA1183905.1 conjugal transfer protein TrbH [Rhizobium tropici]